MTAPTLETQLRWRLLDIGTLFFGLADIPRWTVPTWSIVNAWAEIGLLGRPSRLRRTIVQAIFLQERRIKRQDRNLPSAEQRVIPLTGPTQPFSAADK